MRTLFPSTGVPSSRGAGGLRGRGEALDMTFWQRSESERFWEPSCRVSIGSGPFESRRGQIRFCDSLGLATLGDRGARASVMPPKPPKPSGRCADFPSSLVAGEACKV